MNNINSYVILGDYEMYKFGKTSQARLDTCHPKLQEILNEAIKYTDFSVTCGYRSEADQQKAFESGDSKLKYPKSKHNTKPSMAVDVAPWPIDWDNIPRFAILAGIIKGIAMAKGIDVRLGCDWAGDGDITNQKFMDWPHIELVNPE